MVVAIHRRHAGVATGEGRQVEPVPAVRLGGPVLVRHAVLPDIVELRPDLGVGRGAGACDPHFEAGVLLVRRAVDVSDGVLVSRDDVDEHRQPFIRRPQEALVGAIGSRALDAGRVVRAARLEARALRARSGLRVVQAAVEARARVGVHRVPGAAVIGARLQDELLVRRLVAGHQHQHLAVGLVRLEAVRGELHAELQIEVGADEIVGGRVLVVGVAEETALHVGKHVHRGGGAVESLRVHGKAGLVDVAGDGTHRPSPATHLRLARGRVEAQTAVADDSVVGDEVAIQLRLVQIPRDEVALHVRELRETLRPDNSRSRRA